MARAFYKEDISFFIGDVRDRARLDKAMRDVDWVVHAAALKQAPLGETEPREFILTNIEGSQHVADAAEAAGVARCLLISTDKAVEPINLYGATKMCAERIFSQADRMRGTGWTRFAFTRYGNVVGTAGSVVPFFRSLKPGTPTPVTDSAATRFWITLKDANQFVYDSISNMEGGEVFIPKMGAVNIYELAKTMRPGERIDLVGLRPGDKVHETISMEPRLTSNDVRLLDPTEILRDIA